MTAERPADAYAREPYAPRRQRNERALSVATCERCRGEFEIGNLDERTRVCAPCFDSYLAELEVPFLENYARFGAKAHRTVAEALFREQALADPDDRKIMGMRIVEEYLTAVQDLMAIYLAVRRRGEQPILTTFMNFELSSPAVASFRALTRARTPEELLRDLALPTVSDVEAARGEIPRADYKSFSAATQSVVSGIERAGKVEHQALLQLADGIRTSNTLTHKLDWLPERSMNPDQVALVVLEGRRRVLLTHALAIHEPQLEVFIDAIDKVTAGARDMVWLYLHVRDTFALE